MKNPHTISLFSVNAFPKWKAFAAAVALRFAATRRCQITNMQNANAKKCSILSCCGRVATVTNSQSVACCCPCLHSVVAIFYLQSMEWDNWGTVPANICNELINCRERFAKGGRGLSKGGALPGDCVLWQEGIVYFSQSWSCCSTWNEKKARWNKEE